MKIIKLFLMFLGIVFLLAALFSLVTFAVVKHFKIKEFVEHEIERQLGIEVSIGKLSYSPFLTHVCAEGLTIYNPEGFKESELAYLNAINLVWDPGDMIILKKPTIYVCGVDLERLNIIKNEKGEINIEKIIPVKDKSSENSDTTPFFFDILVLSIDQVNYTEYTPAGSKVHTFKVGMKNQSFINLQDENEVIRLVIYKAIQNTDIAKFINLTISPISGLTDTVSSAWGTAKTGLKSAVDIATMPFKLLFGK